MTSVLTKKILLLYFATFASVQAQAGTCGGPGSLERFGSYRDNFILVNQMRNKPWAQHDEAALRGGISLKYSIAGCPLREGTDRRPAVNRDLEDRELFDGTEFFFSYTNLFDFYAGTRDSGPVVNRLNNPGLHLRVPGTRFGLHERTSFEFSIEHRSNGQALEAGANTEALRRAYERRDRHLFDTISRGMNYLAAQARWDFGNGGSGFDLLAKVYVYTSDETAVSWGPLSGQRVSIKDYQLLSLRGGFWLSEGSRLELSWHVGKGGLKRDSFDLSWQLNKGLPLYLHAHFGPLNTLANYTQRQDSVGIGLRFAAF